MIRESDIPEGATVVTIDCGLEAYLRGRNDPVHFVVTFQFNRARLQDEDLVGSFVSIVTSTVKSALYDRSAPLLTLSDQKGNTFIAEQADVQAFSVLAPEPNTIMEAIAEGEEETDGT